jgi:hypothetical protein
LIYQCETLRLNLYFTRTDHEFKLAKTSRKKLPAGTSVITNLLKQKKDLRVVQVFAGHKKPSSTERYRQTGLEELKAAVLKHHPLG